MSSNKGTYKLLLICNINDNHMIRFIKNLKMYNSNAQIDVFCKYAKMPLSKELNGMINSIFVANQDYNASDGNNFFHRCRRFIKSLKTLNKIDGSKYDIINIHYPKWVHIFYLLFLKRINNKVLLTPWGSDFYRADKNTMFVLKKVYEKADYVCGTGNRFSMDIKQYFELSDTKIVNLDIGSDTIDVISDNLSSISKDEAKKSLSIDGRYVITCGYNGAKAQNHQDIINAIIKIKGLLPPNTVLLFPFTYGGTTAYATELKEYLEKNRLNYLFFESYLELFQLFILRRSTDMFIHVQTTDANAATIQEYLLCGAKVINGEWLRYSELEREGVVPYFICKQKESLADTISEVYLSPEIQIPPSTIDYIKSYGWKNWIVKWNDFFLAATKVN